jgi:predicted RNA-binding Zn-ribbon protein involved in translation (DUF1610 family)
MGEFTCPACGGYIDQAEQDKVEGNFYVCGNCFTVIYRQARTIGDA